MKYNTINEGAATELRHFSKVLEEVTVMLMISPAIIWLIAAIVLAVIELSTMGLVTIWFAIGALVAMIGALFGAGIFVQLLLFIVVSVVILVAVRPLAEKYLNRNIKKTNIDAVVGRKLIAKTDINNLKGIGKVDMEGSTWLAASSNDEVTIPAGTEVVVVKVVGAKLIVDKAE
ncbi:MAG: NfeD family protein [Butyrivibrio sp.]|nr:NfeD family protein [Butyrivibrio sp.]